MQDNQLQALISLVDEPKFDDYVKIRSKILTYGLPSIAILEIAWENSSDEVIQKRLEEIIHSIQFEDVCKSLSEWRKGNNENLLEACLIISKYQFPELNVDEAVNAFSKIKQDIWLEISEDLTSLEKVKVVNHILYEIYKFKGEVSGIDSHYYYYLSNVIETKKGSPLLLGILYSLLAQSLGLYVYGVNLPEHFILAFVDKKVEINNYIQDDVLFYLNPYKQGAAFTKNEVDLFLKELKLEKNKSYYLPCSNDVIIERLLQSLKIIYTKTENVEKSTEIQILIDIMKN